MYVFLMTLMIIVAVLLVLVVLAQNSKGGGLSSQFGGSGASNMIGVKKTGDLLEKITWSLAICLVILAMGSKFLLSGAPTQGTSTTSTERAQQEQSAAPALDLGDAPAEGTQAPASNEQSGSLDDLTGDGDTEDATGDTPAPEPESQEQQ